MSTEIQAAPMAEHKTRRSLLDITDDLAALDALLQDTDGDISNPDVLAAVDQWIAELDADLTGKVDNYAALITTLEGRAEVRAAESKRLAARAKTDTGSADFLRARLKAAFEARGLAKLETARYRVAIQRNGGKQPVRIDDDAAVMRQFPKLVTEIDREALREALEAGTEVRGAALGERGTRLAIK